MVATETIQDEADFCVCGSASPGWKQLELAKVQLIYNHCSPSVLVKIVYRI